VKQTASPQQVIDRLAERWGRPAGRPVTVGLDANRADGVGVRARCARIIKSLRLTGGDHPAYRQRSVRARRRLPLSSRCEPPGCWAHPRTGQPRVDPVVEVKGALKRIRTLLASAPSRDNIEAVAISSDGGDWWQALDAVLTAERTLGKALALFQSQIPVKTNRSPRGRTGALHNQAVARAMAGAWRHLTGRLPAKDNSKFHGLLLAAIVSVFGYPVKEPNLESATKTAVERIRKDAASRS
jgi:hypothetical protein